MSARSSRSTVTSELTFDYGALTTTDNLTNKYDTSIDIGSFDGGQGGSQLNVGGTLINDFSLRIGNANLMRPTTVTANGLFNLTARQPRRAAPSPDRQHTCEATLDINAPAGSGTPGTLSGDFDIEGDALLEFASGQITTITGRIVDQWHARFYCKRFNTTSNSALDWTCQHRRRCRPRFRERRFGAA